MPKESRWTLSKFASSLYMRQQNTRVYKRGYVFMEINMKKLNKDTHWWHVHAYALRDQDVSNMSISLIKQFLGISKKKKKHLVLIMPFNTPLNTPNTNTYGQNTASELKSFSPI